MKRIFSATQPSGYLTLGNYLGAIRNWVHMQEEGDCLFCVVDLHALTVPQDPKTLAHTTRLVAAAYLAAGLNPSKHTFFVQSAVPQHAELGWLFSCITPLGWLNRMTQFKDKAGKDKEKANLGLYAYPVLMAADILLYRATHVPVGEDQKQHLELARDVAGLFNRTFGEDFFPLPEPHITGLGTRVMSLRDGLKKMSKSDPSDMSRINLTDDDDLIAQKIRKAKTDPDPLPETRDALEQRPEALNLVTIYAALNDQTIEEVLKSFTGRPFSVFKPALTELLLAKIGPIRDQIKVWMAGDDLDRILQEGAEKASARAEKSMEDIKRVIGLYRG